MQRNLGPLPVKHTIRLPDSVSDGMFLGVLTLSEVPLAKPVDHNLKALLASIAEGITEVDIDRSPDFIITLAYF